MVAVPSRPLPRTTISLRSLACFARELKLWQNRYKTPFFFQVGSTSSLPTYTSTAHSKRVDGLAFSAELTRQLVVLTVKYEQAGVSLGCKTVERNARNPGPDNRDGVRDTLFAGSGRIQSKQPEPQSHCHKEAHEVSWCLNRPCHPCSHRARKATRKLAESWFREAQARAEPTEIG